MADFIKSFNSTKPWFSISSKTPEMKTESGMVKTVEQKILKPCFLLIRNKPGNLASETIKPK